VADDEDEDDDGGEDWDCERWRGAPFIREATSQSVFGERIGITPNAMDGPRMVSNLSAEPQ
jgi:hypothetical protein